MKFRFISDQQDFLGELSTARQDTNFFPASFFPASFYPTAGHGGGGSFADTFPHISLTPTLPAESFEAQAAVAQSGSGGTGSVVAVTSSAGFTINLIFDAAAMAAPSSFRAGIEQAASILSATITDKITVNIKIDYSGTGGGAAAGPDNGLFESYSTVRTDLINNAVTGDTTFNALPNASTIQGQSSVAVWNAQLKLFGLLSPNDTTTDDGSATFATDISSSLLVGVALHELTHALGRVPYGSQPDIFDLFRYTNSSIGTSSPSLLFSNNIPATAASFSLDGGKTKLADFGLYSDPSDFLNPPNGALSGPYSNLTPNDPFNEIYMGSTLQSLTGVDKQMLDALGFNTIQAGIALAGPAFEAIQGGPAATLLGGAPVISDPASATLSSATIKIANAGGNAVAGDELFVNGTQSGSLGNGVTASWNAAAGTLTLTGSASTAVYGTLLSEVSYQDTGSDSSSGSHPVRTVTWTVSDSSNNFTTTSQITIDRLPAAANSAATDAVGSTVSTTAANGVLSNASDLDGDKLTVTGISDAAHGAGNVGASLAGTYGHLTLNADGSYSYVADNSSAISSAPTGSHLQDSFTYTVSDGNGGTATGSLTVTIAQPLTLTVSNDPIATSGQHIALSSLVTISDPDNVGYQKLELWDSNGTVAGGQFVVNGVAQTGRHEIDVTPANVANTVFDAGTATGSDTLWAQLMLNDGTLSGWQAFTVNVPKPTMTVQSDPAATGGQQIALSTLVSIVDHGHVGYQKLELWDSNGTVAGGQFVVNGVAQTGRHEIDVTPANVANTVFDAGTATGSDTLWAQLMLNDGTLSGWQAFTVNVPKPTMTVQSDPAATGGQQIALSSLVSIVDHGHVGYQKLELWDSNGTVAGGQFVVNGVAQTGRHEIDVTPANVANTVFDAGTATGSDTLWAQLMLNDGTLSGWQAFTVNVPKPAMTVQSDPAATGGQQIALSTLVSIVDHGHVGYQKLELWDSNGTVAGGQFVVNGVAQTGRHEIDVTPANVANTVFDAGTATGSDTLWAQLMLNDGTLSGWQAFTVNVPKPAGQVAGSNPSSLSVTVNQRLIRLRTEIWSGHHRELRPGKRHYRDQPVDLCKYDRTPCGDSRRRAWQGRHHGCRARHD